MPGQSLAPYRIYEHVSLAVMTPLLERMDLAGSKNHNQSRLSANRKFDAFLEGVGGLAASQHIGWFPEMILPFRNEYIVIQWPKC